MKLNSDLGESFGHWHVGCDAQVMPLIDQANIACGFHAGDPVVIAQTLALAKSHGVEIGAHPGYPDLNGFGRRSMALSANELRQCLHYQIAALVGMASVQGLSVRYVKPHGALYNDMMTDAALRQQLMLAIADYPLELALMMQASGHYLQHRQEAKTIGLTLRFEAFADRRYDAQGLLVSRQLPGALLDTDSMMAQVHQLVGQQSVTSQSGTVLSFPVDSLCVHGDNPVGIAQLACIRQVVSGDAH